MQRHSSRDNEGLPLPNNQSFVRRDREVLGQGHLAVYLTSLIFQEKDSLPLLLLGIILNTAGINHSVTAAAGGERTAGTRIDRFAAADARAAITGSRDGAATDGHSTAGTSSAVGSAAADTCAGITGSLDGAATDGHSTAGTSIETDTSAGSADTRTAADTRTVVGTPTNDNLTAADGYRTGVGAL